MMDRSHRKHMTRDQLLALLDEIERDANPAKALDNFVIRNRQWRLDDVELMELLPVTGLQVNVVAEEPIEVVFPCEGSVDVDLSDVKVRVETKSGVMVSERAGRVQFHTQDADPLYCSPILVDGQPVTEKLAAVRVMCLPPDHDYVVSLVLADQ